MTPDAPRGDLGSVEVWRIQTGQIDEVDDCGNISESATYAHEHVVREAEFDGYTAVPGRWRPLDADDALLRVVEAARVLDGIQSGKTRMRDWLIASVNLTRALALLDGGRREGA